jgi:D-proline reductase (dithiol) PrdB
MTNETTSGDQQMRDFATGLPMPQFDTTAFNPPRQISDATVAIVTTAAIHEVDDNSFTWDETSFRVLDRHDRKFKLGHWIPNFDRTGFTADLNVVYPIDRLEELAADGVIGAAAPRHLSFAGNQPDDVATIRHDSGPRAAALLKADGVDVVIISPV